LAAGKIYLEGCNITSLSGFFLEKRFFVSAAHFEPGPAVKAQDYLHGHISTRRYSQLRMFPFLVVSGFRIIIVLCVCTIGERDQSIRMAELIYRNISLDIAVYRLLPDVPDPKHWCSLGQLALGNQIEAGSRVFTVGYNGTSNVQEFVSNAAMYIDKLSPSKRQVILRYYKPTKGLFVSSSSLECAFASPNLTSGGSKLRYCFCAQPAHASCWYAHRPRNRSSWKPLSYRLRVVWDEWGNDVRSQGRGNQSLWRLYVPLTNRVIYCMLTDTIQTRADTVMKPTIS
jgi:hypothetical protein